MGNERRDKSRYPLELNARYQTLGTSASVSGVGKTVNISSGGMLVACRSNLAEGVRLRVTIEWPSLLNGDIPLQLITIGTVVRREELGLVISFESYQFRTMGRARQSNVTTMPERISSNYAPDEARNLSLVAKSSS
jgi:c-di-GMP-binding flagellar brake protein YcgR